MKGTGKDWACIKNVNEVAENSHPVMTYWVILKSDIIVVVLDIISIVEETHHIVGLSNSLLNNVANEFVSIS